MVAHTTRESDLPTPQLPLSKGKRIPRGVQVGCGFRIKSIGRQEYVYFWHYEGRNGRSRQVYEYMGPRRSASTARRLAAALEAYYASAAEALRTQLVRQRGLIAALG